MRNTTIQTPDKNFLKIHADLAALYDEIKEKEGALQQLMEEKKTLKLAIRAKKSELKKRLIAIGAWQNKAEATTKTIAKKQPTLR